ncbi:MAG: 4Fe-4S binding protein [Thermodesulfovibrionia bacterium]|nr:4Fe-4S binding protein [Thermodesulfovibrionia bacterium]
MSEEEKKKEIKMEDVKTRAEEKKCPVQKSLVFIQEFLGGPMCGKCFPCSLGSYEAERRLRRLMDATATDDDIASIRRIASHMLTASMCKKGKDTAKFIMENIDSHEFREHLSGRCADNECTGLIQYVVIPERCTMCGICQEVCRDNAIIGEKKTSYLSGYTPFEIVQKRCTRCGECMKVCPYEAIVLISSREAAEKETVAP